MLSDNNDKSTGKETTRDIISDYLLLMRIY